ncbi:PHD and RING finger domain-containing protein 1-like protein [Perkinsela sp. CCAP 1560/4]|nr:PHD and RING finger domain-containing protein 1-like protein [Perkinsela sp. CCAP 1560/4]|eukprot:KNH07533.1 PHD and RING finger domain-containing protein 1-like protein [Perkinsela sp. CCAP 1560/4]
MTCVETENFCVICDPTNAGGGSELDCSLPNCTHEFHYECIYTWVTSRTNTCPVCRHTVKSLRHVKKVNGRKETKIVRIKNKKYEEDESDILYVVQHLSESEDLENILCNICLEDDGRDDALLLCSTRGCPSAAHYDCLDPPLLGVPEGDWFCPACAELYQTDEEVENLNATENRPEQRNFPSNDSNDRRDKRENARSPIRPTTMSALDICRMNNEDIFGVRQSTPPKKKTIEKTAIENRVLLDSPENVTLARWKPIEQTPPRPLHFPGPVKGVDEESKLQPVYTQWKKTGPPITPAPSIIAQSTTKPAAVHTSEEFSSYVRTNSHDTVNTRQSFHDTLALHRYRPPVNQFFSTTPAARIGSTTSDSAPSKSPHPRFPIHRTLAGEHLGDQSRRKRPAADESLSQSSITHEVKETLKDLTRNHKITPHEAVFVQRSVEREVSERQRSISASSLHHMIEKYLKCLPKNPYR